MTIRLYPGPAAIRGDADPLLHESARVRAAALHARRTIPGVIGELVHRELTAYADFGYRFTADALIPRLVAEVLAVRSPEVPDPGQRPAGSSGRSSSSGASPDRRVTPSFAQARRR